MDALRWKRVQELFHEAVQLPGPERQEFLLRMCNGDNALQATLERLLSEDQNALTEWERDLAAKGAGLQSSSNSNAELPYEDLGPYRFVRPLGQGGMGTVYQAEHRATKQIVAVKVLRTGELSVASRERFATEQRALARLNHPSIARLYASEKFRDGTPCFVMEYVEGEALTVYCRKRASSIRERILLFRQVCEAVQHAHEHAIIHRDLKPSNILVKSDGTVRLLDFGIAKQLDRQDDAPDITGMQRAPMSIAYAAPEQIAGARIGTQTDVYALGVTLYELLTERLPLNLADLTRREMEFAIQFQVPEQPSRVVQEGRVRKGTDREERLGRTEWSDLDVLCGTAIHKDPDRRYRSVEALIRDLDHWLRSEPLEAQRDTVRYRLSKFWQRNRRALLLTSAVVFLIGSAATWFGIRLARARDTAIREQVRTQRVERFVIALFDEGGKSAGPAKTATALGVLDRGRREAEALKNEPDFQAQLYEVLGEIYRKLGKANDAERLLNAAMKERSKQGWEGDSFKSADLVALGLIRADQSRLEEAETLVRSGIVIARKSRPATPLALGRAESALGEVLLQRHQFKAALPPLFHAMQLQDVNHAPEGDRSDTLGRLAEARQQAGQYGEAVSLNRRALAIDSHAYGELHPRVADDLTSLASAHFMENDLRESEQEFRQALQIDHNWYGDEHPMTLFNIIGLGQTLSTERQFGPAREMLTKGLDIGSRVLGQNNEKVLLALNALATLEQNTGNFTAAEPYFLRMITSAKKVYGDPSFVLAVGKANLGVLYEKQGRHSDAESLLRQALANLVLLLPPGHHQIGDAHLNLGRAFFGERRFSEAH